MYKLILIGSLIICFLIGGCASDQKLTSVEGMPLNAPITTINIKGENCTWVPDKVNVEKGDHVILEVNSVDWDYNFMLEGYDLRFNIPKGETVSAELYALETGEFEFGCYIEMGLHYNWGGMTGKLVVGTNSGLVKGPSDIDEQKTIAKAYAEIKCDPCDYNIDYGDTYHPTGKGGVDEGFVKLECDPCDYNIDYGETYNPTEK
jgi:hypothetical protein